MLEPATPVPTAGAFQQPPCEVDPFVIGLGNRYSLPPQMPIGEGHIEPGSNTPPGPQVEPSLEAVTPAVGSLIHSVKPGTPCEFLYKLDQPSLPATDPHRLRYSQEYEPDAVPARGAHS